MSDEALAAFSVELGRRGLNLVGCVPAAAARTALFAGRDCPVPDGGTVVICGSGGRAHWDALPLDERSRTHPIAAAAQRTIDAALPRLDATARQVEPAEIAAFDLRALAEQAGWGVISPYLELLIHPVFGPWVSIRSLVFTARALPATGPLAGFDPCGPCPRPCLDACPVGAYRRGHAWDFARCAEHRLQERVPAQDCADQCHARLACIVGPEHAYDPDERRHRHRASLADVRRWFRDADRPEES